MNPVNNFTPKFKYFGLFPVQIHFWHNIFICQPIFKLFAAHFTTKYWYKNSLPFLYLCINNPGTCIRRDEFGHISDLKAGSITILPMRLPKKCCLPLQNPDLQYQKVLQGTQFKQEFRECGRRTCIGQNHASVPQ